MKIKIIFHFEEGQLYLFAYSNQSLKIGVERFEPIIPIITIRDLINHLRVEENINTFIASIFGENYQIVIIEEALTRRWFRLN